MTVLGDAMTNKMKSKKGQIWDRSKQVKNCGLEMRIPQNWNIDTGRKLAIGKTRNLMQN